MKEPTVFQNILNELERIRWEVQRIEKNVLMVRTFAEELFQNEREVLKKGYWKKSPFLFGDKDFRVGKKDAGVSCVFAGNSRKLKPGDEKFVKATGYLDLIFRPLFENNPYILFSYIISKTGITRGYPWKDFSVLPPGFDPTQQSFFFIADQKHDPLKKVKWTEPYLCPLTKTWMVTCSSPVWKNSKFVGVIGIDVNLGKIIEPLGLALKKTGKGYAFIISPRGNLIISSDEGMDSLREDGILIEGSGKGSKWRSAFFKRPSLNKPLPLGTRIREIELTSGKRYLLYTFLKTPGWSLVTLLPQGIDDVSKKAVVSPKKESPASPLSPYGNDGGAYLPLISFVSSFSESVRQMEKLIEGTKIIGKGVLDHRIQVNRKDEIGLIAESINKMARELKKRKEELELAYRRISQLDRLMAIGRLAAGIAHELNNPLGVISNYVQMLLRKPSLGSEVKIDLMLIEEEILGMMGIIKGLLNFSRESEMKKSPIHINEVLRKTTSLLKFQLGSQSIQLSEKYDEELPLVLGDSNHLQQVFLNILLNSIQSMPDGGRLELKTSLTNGNRRKADRPWVVVDCLDTGVGIEPRDLDKIFDPFFTTKGVGIGTGLGLSISYGIIKEHGGNIDVKSSPGQGTLVRTTLPTPEDPSAREDGRA